ncbi:MAG: formate/nitrite transporter family protein [Eggerthellaceae bacterium]|nr:formate/nitrite transporter family protein [Eggerthellaceae bacterium]
MAMFNPIQICDNYMEASVGKANSPAWRLLVLGFAAGAFIAFGAVASSTAVHALDNVGLVRLVTALVFPVGICMVIILGTELFTGNVLMVTAVIEKKISWAGLARNWALVYVGNFLGAVTIAALMAFFGQMDIGAKALAVYTAKVAAAKSSLPWANAFVLGIFCNTLVCLAIYMGSSAQDTAGKILGLYLPIMAFVVSGFEHCVANMYYIPAGILANLNPAYTPLIAEAGVDAAVLDFATFFTANLVPVTLGNIVGGLLVGLLLYYTHSRPRSA